MQRFAAALAAAALAGTAAHANQAGPAGDPEYYVEGLRCLGGKYSLTLPATLPRLMAVGPGARVEVLRREESDGDLLVHERVRFDGLILTLIAYGRDPDRYSLEKVEIRSATWGGLSPFTVGQDVDEARDVLGAVAHDDVQLRSVYSGENESLRFETKAGRVAAVVYECYTG
ncbi:MAG TPA: hypothetical protein VLT89_02990 [Usitatibacter sp.]|nr:hypothetical protein [Usitatibacter sp.]